MLWWVSLGEAGGVLPHPGKAFVDPYPILTKISNVIQGGIKKSKYHKNTSEINELERYLLRVKMLAKNIEKQKS